MICVIFVYIFLLLWKIAANPDIYQSVISSPSSVQFCSRNFNFKCSGRDIQILRGTPWRHRDASLQLFLNVASNPSQFHFQGKCETEDFMTDLTTECHFLSHSSFTFILNVLLQCLPHAKLSWISLPRTESTAFALFAIHFPSHNWW